MHCGLDFYRGDMHDQRVASVDLCVKLCDITPGCTAMSYESSTEDGLNGMCWLKNGIIGGFQRPRKWIVGMYKADLALSSPIPAWFRPRPVGMPSATAWSTLMSTLSRSVSVTTTHSPEANAFVTPTGAVSVATVKSPSITSSSKPSATADQGQSGGRTFIGPPFWFTEAHPCYPSECTFPVTYVGRTSYPAPSTGKSTVTKSVVMTKVSTRSKNSATESSTIDWPDSLTWRTTKPTGTWSTGYHRPTLTSTVYSSHSLVPPGSTPYSTGRISRTAMGSSSSGKGYVAPSITLLHSPPVLTTSSSQHSSQSSGHASSKVTHSPSPSKYEAVSTISLTTVVTKTRKIGISTLTTYTILPTKPVVTSTVRSVGTGTSKVHQPLPGKTSVTSVVSWSTVTRVSTIHKPVPSKTSVGSVLLSGISNYSTITVSGSIVTSSNHVITSTRTRTLPVPSPTRGSTVLSTRKSSLVISSSASSSTVTVSGSLLTSSLSTVVVTSDLPQPAATSRTDSNIHFTSTGYDNTVVPSIHDSGPATSGYIDTSSPGGSYPVVSVPSKTESSTQITGSMPSPKPTDSVTPTSSGRRTPITKSVSATSHWSSKPKSGEDSGSSRLVFSSSFAATVGLTLSLVVPFVVW